VQQIDPSHVPPQVGDQQIKVQAVAAEHHGTLMAIYEPGHNPDTQGISVLEQGPDVQQPRTGRKQRPEPVVVRLLGKKHPRPLLGKAARDVRVDPLRASHVQEREEKEQGRFISERDQAPDDLGRRNQQAYRKHAVASGYQHIAVGPHQALRAASASLMISAVFRHMRSTAKLRFGPPSEPGADLPAKGGVMVELQHAVGKCAVVTGHGKEPRAVRTNSLPDAGDIGGAHRKACRHGFQDRVGNAFAFRTVDKQIRGGQQAVNVSHLAEEADRAPIPKSSPKRRNASSRPSKRPARSRTGEQASPVRCTNSPQALTRVA